MVELVDTYALGAYASQRAGSSPVPGTRSIRLKGRFFYCQTGRNSCYNDKQDGENCEIFESVDGGECF